MKKFVFGGLAFVLALILALMFYGAYLNIYGEKIITQRMEDKRLSLSGVRPQMRKLHPNIQFDSITLKSSNMADAVAVIDGRVVDIAVAPNEEVVAGQVICTMYNGEYALKIQEIESNIMGAEAKLQQAKTDYERYHRLWQQEAAPKEKMEAKETEYKATQNQLEALKAQKEQQLLLASFQTVTAPISGRVLLIYQPAGSFVKAGASIMLIGKNGNLSFSMAMDDILARWCIVGQHGHLSFSRKHGNSSFKHADIQKVYDTPYGVGNRGEEEEVMTTVTSVEPPLSEPAQIRRVTWEVDNSAGILDMKTYTDVDLRSEAEYERLSVPTNTVIWQGGRKLAVMVFDADETLQLREVEVGIIDGDYVEIVSGLSEDDVVITSGKEGLKPGMKVKVKVEES